MSSREQNRLLPQNICSINESYCNRGSHCGSDETHQLLSCVRMPGFWEHNHVRHFRGVILPNYSYERLWLRHFRITKTFEMMFSEIGLLVGPVINHTHCWGKVTWLFLLCIEGFI